MDERLAPGYRASTISLGLNGGLAVVKLVCGIAGNSYALVADAIESLGDIFSSAIVWSGLVIASKPADANHPYGHGKAEPLAALLVALMLVAAAATIATQAIHEIHTPHQTPATYTLFVLLGVVVVKEAMYRYEDHAGRLCGSMAVAVDAWHHRSDAITSAAAAIGITIALVGGPGYEPADDWAALAACGIIIVNAVHFVRTAVGELMDASPEAALIESIQAASLKVEGALFVEKVLVRKMGPQMYVDLHLEVDPDLPVREAHRIAHRVKDSIMADCREVADVLVHVEPGIDRSGYAK
jgi:cation diffusion facilitator family transporter